MNASEAEHRQSELIERLRSRLAAEPTAREIAVFGGLSFTVNNALVARGRRTP